MTKLAGDHVQVFVEGYELTGDINKLSLSDARDQHDVTTFGDAVHRFINGQRLITLDHMGFLNPAAARAHPVLNGLAIAGIVSILLGQNAPPVIGDPTFSLQTRQSQYHTLPAVNQGVPFTAKFANRGNLGCCW